MITPLMHQKEEGQCFRFSYALIHNHFSPTQVYSNQAQPKHTLTSLFFHGSVQQLKYLSSRGSEERELPKGFCFYLDSNENLQIVKQFCRCLSSCPFLLMFIDIDYGWLQQKVVRITNSRIGRVHVHLLTETSYYQILEGFSFIYLIDTSINLTIK